MDKDKNIGDQNHIKVSNMLTKYTIDYKTNIEIIFSLL